MNFSSLNCTNAQRLSGYLVMRWGRGLRLRPVARTDGPLRPNLVLAEADLA